MAPIESAQILWSRDLSSWLLTLSLTGTDNPETLTRLTWWTPLLARLEAVTNVTIIQTRSRDKSHDTLQFYSTLMNENFKFVGVHFYPSMLCLSQ